MKYVISFMVETGEEIYTYGLGPKTSKFVCPNLNVIASRTF